MGNGEIIDNHREVDLENYIPERNLSAIGEKIISSAEDKLESDSNTELVPPEIEMITLSETPTQTEISQPVFNPKDNPEKIVESIMKLDDPSEMVRQFHAARREEEQK
jgi:hypothetical protein